MDRNRFIQCMKSNVELSDKERRRIIRKSVESQPWKLKCTIAMEEFAELTFAWNSLSLFLILHRKNCRKLWMLNYREKGINRDE